MQEQSTGLAELRVLDHQRLGVQIDLIAIEAAGFAGAHPCHRKQPDQRCPGRGPQRLGQPAAASINALISAGVYRYGAIRYLRSGSMSRVELRWPDRGSSYAGRRSAPPSIDGPGMSRDRCRTVPLAQSTASSVACPTTRSVGPWSCSSRKSHPPSCDVDCGPNRSRWSRRLDVVVISHPAPLGGLQGGPVVRRQAGRVSDNAAADAYRLLHIDTGAADLAAAFRRCRCRSPVDSRASSALEPATAGEMTTLLSPIWTVTAAPTVADLPNHSASSSTSLVPAQGGGNAVS